MVAISEQAFAPAVPHEMAFVPHVKRDVFQADDPCSRDR